MRPCQLMHTTCGSFLSHIFAAYLVASLHPLPFDPFLHVYQLTLQLFLLGSFILAYISFGGDHVVQRINSGGARIVDLRASVSRTRTFESPAQGRTTQREDIDAWSTALARARTISWQPDI